MSRVQKKGFQLRCLLWASVAGVTLLAGCAAPRHDAAPIMDGGTTTIYTVQRGDTLYSIARRYGVDPVLVARQNNLINPSQLTVGQKLRIGVDRRPGGPQPNWNGAVTRPVAISTAPTSSAPAKPVTFASRPTETTLKPLDNAPSAAKAGAGRFQWPIHGNVIKGYSDSNKGLDIAATEGAPVKAAADGTVLYVGQVRGYGNLVIVKHDGTFVTAYGNNKSIDVTQGAAVKQGQKIASAGKTDDEPARVHFEIRQNGKAINPVGLLPAR